MFYLRDRAITPREYRAQPQLQFIPQRVNPFLLRLVMLMLPIFLRFRLRSWLPAGISQIQVTNAKILAEFYQQFQGGKIRLLFAARHVEVDDPLSMMYLFSRTLPRTARKLGISLQYPFFSHFLYDRGMTLWAGRWLGWVFSRLGGVPIHRGKSLDREAIRTVRELLINGTMPIAIAPEGATNGHSEIVSPLKSGTAQLGFWCVEDLQKANRSEEVFIIPIGIQYYYVTPPWRKLDGLLSQLEADCGLAVQGIGSSASEIHKDIFSQRLFNLGEAAIAQMEAFYRDYYYCQFPDRHAGDTPEAVLGNRLQMLLEKALQVCEQYFHLQPQGNISDRCRRLEEAGWCRIYRQDSTDPNLLSPLQRGLADWIAHESAIRMRHLRLVESFVAVTGTYIQEKPTIERFAETALIIFDAIARLKGTKVPHRPRLGWRKSQVTIGTPISVTQFYLNCQQDSPREHRQAVKKAVKSLTTELQIALEKMISP
ncbi:MULTISPECIES: 1-acyl-sn-glycerol-3-phosphate acyltransferase [Spirulina sp. CCY15215]|uniref:lysophospholipid acyltransferase family protein n=1 Tax=Spirulina sp. CCY15215 TaxID=2767591 RepID=UPI001EF29770|nr:1-acyl-sn-glycerol-3-phosphate acyltransferase [Spirulina major]